MNNPTDEQRQALEKFRTCKPLKIKAFAGAGKTTTLTLLARSRSTRGVYLAFNKSIADEAKEKFPRTVDCRTTHSIAWRTVQPRYSFSSGKMSGRISPRQLAEELNLKDLRFQGPPPFRLTDVQQAHLIRGTLRSFCQSADVNLSIEHVPEYGRLLGMPDEIIKIIKAYALKEAVNLWKRMTNHRDKIPLGHDGYLKLWALGQPRFDADFVMLDEAQDTNPVVLGVMNDQSAQCVFVGDRHQQIYEWRGAINAMEKIAGEEAYLTQSFRFGPAIANAATQVLRTLGETRDVRGNPAVRSAIGAFSGLGTILARTNATVLAEVLDALNEQKKPHVIGGIEELRRLLGDVFDLKKGQFGSTPEFFGFDNWDQVVAFSETEEGEDLKTFVQIVEKYGERRLWAALANAENDEEAANVIVSTAHKAKGREWDNVRLAPDFMSSRLVKGSPNAAAEVRLFYVAMTRAKLLLSVDSVMLETFASGAWKTREPERKQGPLGSRTQNRAGPDSSRAPPPPFKPERQSVGQHELVRETVRAGVREAHPGAVRTPAARPVENTLGDDVRSRHPGFASEQPVPRTSASPPGENAGHRAAIREVVHPSVQAAHPASVRPASQQSAPKIPGKPSIWGRLSKLFGG